MAPLVCAHKWRIETPNGPKARGCCKHCGTTRLFPTTIEVPETWEKGSAAYRMHKTAKEAKALRVLNGDALEDDD